MVCSHRRGAVQIERRRKIVVATVLFVATITRRFRSCLQRRCRNSHRVLAWHGVFHDAGRSWQWHDLPLESYGALRLEIADGITLLATSPSGLYISRDNGATWTKAQSGLPASAVSDLLVRPEFWVVSSEKSGLYISRDQGANWSRIESPSNPAHADYFPVIDAGFATDSIYAASANESLFLVELARPSVLAARLGAGHRP